MNPFRTWKILAFFAVFGACAVLPRFVHNDYMIQVLFRIVLFAALGLAWNLVGGYAGQLSLGHVAFFGLGAYGLAIFTARGIPAWISVFAAAFVAAVFATIIGRIVFRLRGPYFTLATIAFAEVLRLSAANLTVTGGAIGLSTPALFRGSAAWRSYYLSAVALAVICFLMNYATERSRPGYYLMAIREDEETASVVGIDTAGYKARALVISAFLTALGGGLYAGAFQYIIPDSVFTLDISVQVAIIAILGGAGTLTGPIMGAVLLLTAAELFKNQFQESHLLIYGILIVVVVLFLPEGIVGGLRQLAQRVKTRPSRERSAAFEAKGGS